MPHKCRAPLLLQEKRRHCLRRSPTSRPWLAVSPKTMAICRTLSLVSRPCRFVCNRCSLIVPRDVLTVCVHVPVGVQPPGVIDDSTTTNVEALDDEPPAAAESYLIAPFAPVTKGRGVSVAGSDSDDVSPPQSPYERARSCRSSGVSSRRASEDADRSPHASRQSSPATASVRDGASVAVSGAGSTASCVDASLDAYSSASAPTLAPATGVGSCHGDAVSDGIPVTPAPAVGDASGEGLAALDTGSVAMSGRPLDVVGGEVAGELSSPSFFRRTQQRVSSLLGRQPEV